MNVYFGEGTDQLAGELILEWILRSDLTPIPRTVELTVKVGADMEDRLKVGASFWTGRELLKYEVVKVERADPAGVVQGGQSLQAMKVTALLAMCAQIGYRRQTAVVSRNRTIGDVYRSCGAEAAIATDITVPQFTCFKGQVPSNAIATVLQERGAVLVLRNKAISVMRVADLFNQTPIDAVGQADTSAKIESEFLERHEIPMYFSTDDAGAFVMGADESARTTLYWPRTDEGTLRNMSQVLVKRKVVPSAMCQEVVAGDVMNVGGELLVVMTAAHRYTQRDGTTESSSRLWLGALSK